MPIDEHRAGGVMFPNTRKTSPAQPDFQGTITVDRPLMNELLRLDGQGAPLTLRLAGWKKQSAKGNNFISLKPDVDRPAPQQAPRQHQPQPSAFSAEDDDSCPF